MCYMLEDLPTPDNTCKICGREKKAYGVELLCPLCDRYKIYNNLKDELEGMRLLANHVHAKLHIRNMNKLSNVVLHGFIKKLDEAVNTIDNLKQQFQKENKNATNH